MVTNSGATGFRSRACVRTVNAGVGYVWSAKLIDDPIKPLVLVTCATDQVGEWQGDL